MTARTKVTLEEAAEIKDFLVQAVVDVLIDAAMAGEVVDRFFAIGVIDPDAALRQIDDSRPGEPD